MNGQATEGRGPCPAIESSFVKMGGPGAPRRATLTRVTRPGLAHSRLCWGLPAVCTWSSPHSQNPCGPPCPALLMSGSLWGKRDTDHHLAFLSYGVPDSLAPASLPWPMHSSLGAGPRSFGLFQDAIWLKSLLECRSILALLPPAGLDVPAV